MFPFRDHNPTKNFPIVTVILIILNAMIFGYTLLLQFSHGNPDAFVVKYAFVPHDLLRFKIFSQVNWLVDIKVVSSMISSMFLHGSVSHIAGNMLYLWIFGNNIEDIMGPIKFIIFYIICGIAACLAQGFSDINSTVPMIGASGAISGVLGAYLVKFPKAKVDTCVFFIIITIIRIPAVLVLVAWFLLQLVSIGDIAGVDTSVAYYAHIGGFLAGMLLVNLFENKSRREFNI